MTVDYTEDTAVFTWEAKNRGSREAFFVTTLDAMAALEDLQASLLVDGKERDLNPLHIEYPEYDGRETKLNPPPQFFVIDPAYFLKTPSDRLMSRSPSFPGVAPQESRSHHRARASDNWPLGVFPKASDILYGELHRVLRSNADP